MKLGLKKMNFSPLGTGNTHNLAKFVALNGNVRVLSSICIIDSSHHSVGITTSTFFGQNGESFLTNLVENLIEADGFRNENRVVVNFHARTFGLVLERIHIPFLFPAGMKLPTFFKEHLSDANYFNERSVNFGEYERTRNGDEIDSIFKYFVKNERRIPSIGICAVECKNWARNLLIGDLKPILIKAVSNSANLSLVFCNSLGTSKAETCEAFKSLCQTKFWNVLKLRKLVTKPSNNNSNNKGFVLERYFPEMNFLTDAA